jgi:DNA-binding CsgD family transcriptional regulator
MQIDPEYDQLIQLIYQGALELQPWQSALPRLRELLDAQVVSLVLRPPSEDHRGAILNCVRTDTDQSGSQLQAADSEDWEVTAYREEFFSLDPFVNLPPDQVITLEDLMSDQELLASDYYRYYLQPIDLFQILGVDTIEPGGMLARLRISRRRSEPRFCHSDRELVAAITPHLQRAITFYAQLSRARSERDIYAGAVDQLSVATIILDEQARVLSTNALASALLEQGDGLSLRRQQLQVEGRDLNQALQEAVGTIIRAQQQGQTSLVRALRIPRPGGRADLGLIVRPAPASVHSEGQASPAVAVFVSDPELTESASQQTLEALFGLTPAEARLAIRLSRGASLAKVADSHNISQHTARAQLKSVFAKTGVSRQAELVRLVLKSVASLG